MKKLLTALGIVLLLACPAWAMDVTLQWDANTEPDLAGYKIYYDAESGAPYSGTGATEGDSPIDIPLVSDENPDPDIVEFTVHNIPVGVETYFVVTAYDDETPSLESGYSNEVNTSAMDCVSPAIPENCRVIIILCQ